MLFWFFFPNADFFEPIEIDDEVASPWLVISWCITYCQKCNLLMTISQTSQQSSVEVKKSRKVAPGSLDPVSLLFDKLLTMYKRRQLGQGGVHVQWHTGKTDSVGKNWKPQNRRHGRYQPWAVPSCPWCFKGGSCCRGGPDVQLTMANWLSFCWTYITLMHISIIYYIYIIYIFF